MFIDKITFAINTEQAITVTSILRFIRNFPQRTLKKRQLQSLIIFFLVTSLSHASNYRFLSDSAVISKYNDQDMELLMSNIQKTLNENKNGEVVKWFNKETGHNGELTPLSNFSKYNMQCRKLRVVNRADNKEGVSNFNYCKTKDGPWKIAP